MFERFVGSQPRQRGARGCHPPATRSSRPEMLSLVTSSRVSSLRRPQTHPAALLTARRFLPQTLARSAAPRSVVGAWVAQRGLATAADPYDLVVIGGGEPAFTEPLDVEQSPRIETGCIDEEVEKLGILVAHDGRVSSRGTSADSVLHFPPPRLLPPAHSATHPILIAFRVPNPAYRISRFSSCWSERPATHYPCTRIDGRLDGMIRPRWLRCGDQGCPARLQGALSPSFSRSLTVVLTLHHPPDRMR